MLPRYFERKEGAITMLTFDTKRFVNRLKSGGVPTKQAQAEASALAEVLGRVEYEMRGLRRQMRVLRGIIGVLAAGFATLLLKVFALPLF